MRLVLVGALSGAASHLRCSALNGIQGCLRSDSP